MNYAIDIGKSKDITVATVLKKNDDGTINVVEIFRGKTALKRANLKLHQLKMEDAYESNRVVVRTGKCPTCGAGLKRNLSMAGWWQCEQYGAVGWRKDPSLPSCNFQIFTE